MFNAEYTFLITCMLRLMTYVAADDFNFNGFFTINSRVVALINYIYLVHRYKAI